MNHLPSIRDAEGRLVPLEPDRIVQALFDAGAEIGRPSAFLARELTEGVLHFLTAENVPEPPTQQQLVELVSKVVRELGHPDLARSYRERSERPAPPPPVHHAPRKTPADEETFTRDLQSAQEEGLLLLPSPTFPWKLQSLAVKYPAATPSISLLDWQQTLVEQGRLGRCLVLPHDDAWGFPNDPERAGDWLRATDLILQAAALQGVLSLGQGAKSTPAKSEDSPLFGGDPTVQAETDPAGAWNLFQAWNRVSHSPLAIDWQIHPDRAGLEEQQWGRLGNAAAREPGILFRFPRTGRPGTLAPGIDGNLPGCLETIVLPLSSLFDSPEVGRNIDNFLEKLGGLAGMAVSAGCQIRMHLRRRLGPDSPLARGFLLNRSSLLVRATGLEIAVAEILGVRPEESRASLDLAVTILERLREALDARGRRMGLETRLEAVLGQDGESPASPDSPATEKRIHTAAILHQAAGGGTVDLSLTRFPTGPELVKLLRIGWARTGLASFRLVAKRKV